MNGSEASSENGIAVRPASACPTGNATQRSSVLTTFQVNSPVSGTGSQVTATSTSPPANPADGSPQDTCRNWSRQSGNCTPILAVTDGIRPRPMRFWNPTVRTISCRATTSATSRRASSHRPIIADAWLSRARPAGVSTTERRARSNSAVRRDASSRRICLLSVGCAMNNRLAALVKLSSSATATK